MREDIIVKEKKEQFKHITAWLNEVKALLILLLSMALLFQFIPFTLIGIRMVMVIYFVFRLYRFCLRNVDAFNAEVN